MSALNIVVLPEVAHIFCDGAAYDQAGRLTSQSSKIRTLPSISAAVGATGRAQDSDFLVNSLERNAESFDHLKANIEAWLPEITAECEDYFGTDDHGTGQRLAFAGWSESKSRCEAFAICTFDTPSNDAYETVDIRGGSQSPVLSEDELILGWGRRPTMDDIKSIDYMAVTSLELQRRQPFPCGNYLVGGFAELVTVTKDAITSRILKRWPEDEVGELITPKKIDWSEWRAARTKVEIPPGMSRAKAELMKRRAAKGKLAV